MSAAPVWLLTDEATDRHHAPGHPERPDRRWAAAEGVRAAAGERLVLRPCRAATRAELEGVHDAGYLDLLETAELRGGAWLDPDTYLVPGSCEAARLAAGATLDAALASARGEAEVAFAAVRPPGHHATVARGSGFCLVNNIAVAVAGLRAAGVAQRIAIVDWDVHHGDGTQAIFDADPDLCYLSSHQFPFYPGTGRPTDRGIGAGAGSKHNVPLAAGDGDAAFVAAWEDELVPVAERFGPEAILVSAGYDAHAADPLAELAVTEAGFEAVGTAVGSLSARLGHGGVAMTLEGGYDLDAVRASVAASVRGLLTGRASPA